MQPWFSISTPPVVPDISEVEWLGQRFRREERFDRSLEQFWSMLQQAREFGHRDLEATALNHIGMVYQAWGKFDHALKFYDQSLDLCQSIRFSRGTIAVLNNMARLHESRGRLDKAKDFYEQSLQLSEFNGELTTRRSTLLGMARCLEKLGDFLRCRKLLREVVEIDHVLKHPDTRQDRAYLEKLKNRP